MTDWGITIWIEDNETMNGCDRGLASLMLGESADQRGHYKSVTGSGTDDHSAARLAACGFAVFRLETPGPPENTRSSGPPLNGVLPILLLHSFHPIQPAQTVADTTFVTTSLPLTDQSPRSERTRWIILFAFCILSAIIGRFCYLARPFDNDAAIFIYMGKMVSQGGRMCHDLIDNKFPTVGLMTSIAWRAFGLHWWAYIAFQTCLSLIGVLILSRMAARHVGRYAVIPTALFALLFFNFTIVVFGGFQLETFQVFFSILAARSALLAMESDQPADSFVTGLCAGCGAMFKPTALAVLGAMALGLWLGARHRQNLRRFPWHLFAAAAGVVIPLTGALVYLMTAHMLGDMPALWRQISTYARESVWAGEDATKPLVAATFLGFPLVVRAWVFRRQREPGMNWPSQPVVTFAVAWLALEAAGIVMQKRMYPYHFLPLLPPVALLFGFVPRACRPIPLAAALLPMMLVSAYAAGDVITMTYTARDRLPVSGYLAAHANPDDAVWMNFWPRLLLETDLRPGSRYPFTFLFTNYDRAGLDYAAGILQDFQRVKPAYIILPVKLEQEIYDHVNFIAELKRSPLRAKNYTIGWHEIRDYTLNHYDCVAIVHGQAVYHRRTDAELEREALASNKPNPDAGLQRPASKIPASTAVK